jgi:large repetitive protein
MRARRGQEDAMRQRATRYGGGFYLRPGQALAVLLGVLCASAASASTPSVGAELGTDEPIQGITFMPDDQEWPSVAFNGSVFLVVWQDARTFGEDLYAARVKPDGTVLDPGGIPIATVDDHAKLWPAVAFDGTNFLVVWSDARQPLAGLDVYGARVSPEGAVLDSQGIRISALSSNDSTPAVSCRPGLECLVVWDAGGRLDGARVRPDGVVLDPWSLELDGSGGATRYPSVATNGTDYLVAYQYGESGQGVADIRGVRMQPDGTRGAPSLLVGVMDDQVFPATASDGTDYLVSWADRRGGTLFEAYAMRVGAAGNLLEPGGFPLGSSGHCAYASAGFDGNQYLVAWSCGSSVQATRVSRSGTPLGLLGLSASPSAWKPVVAAAPGGSLVVWDDGRHSSRDIYGTRVESGGAVLDSAGLLVTRVLNGISNGQSTPVVGFAGSHHLVVWEDFRQGTGTSDLYAVRMAQDGTVLDPRGILLSRAPGSQVPVRIAFDGTNALVVWRDQRNGNWDLYGARVAADGTVLDPEGLLLVVGSREPLNPDLACGGGTCLLVWDELRDGTLGREIVGARISSNGQVLEPGGFLISNFALAQSNPAVAFDGTNFLVVWEDFRHYALGQEVYGARVTPGGQVLDGMGFVIHTDLLRSLVNPVVAFLNGVYLVAWQRPYTSGPDNAPADDLHAVRVLPGAKVLDASPLTVTAAAGRQHGPQVVQDGQDFLVAWHDNRSGTGQDLYAARVKVDGTVLDGGGFGVATLSTDESRLQLVSGGGGRSFVAYDRWDASVPYQTERVRLRLIQQP